MKATIEQLKNLLDERIVVLDGSYGVLIQKTVKGEEAYRGERFADHPRDVAGDPDLLNLTQPDVVRDIHRSYLAAGADIVTTNTFTATTIGQADYALEPFAYEMNVEGARLAREAADELDRPAWVAGSIGPLNVSLSLSPKVDDPAYRSATFDQVREAYAEQIRGLAEGGVDMLLIETIFDTLNAKAAIVAAKDVAPDVPLWISFTAIDKSGRNLSGPDGRGVLDVDRARRSAHRRRQLLARRDRDAPVRRGPRAGRDDVRRLPPERRPAERDGRARRAAGRHEPHPRRVRPRRPRQRRRRLLRHDAGAREGDRRRGRAREAPRRFPPAARRPRFSGLEPFEIGPDTGFVMVGERTNVTGSARFRRLVEADDFQGAVDVALEQVRGGANLLDVNMDADLLDSEQAMTTFLNVDRDRARGRADPDHGRQLALVGRSRRA